MADERPRSRMSRSSLTPDRSSSPAPSTRSNRSQRRTQGLDLLRPHQLRRAESRFSLNEHFATSRREYDFEGDDSSFSESASLLRGEEAVDDNDDGIEESSFEDHLDLYTVLGLSRDENPTTAQISAAYEWHKTALSMNQDQPTPELKAAIRKRSAIVNYAHETLKHPHRRVIYDLFGEHRLRQEYTSGIMSKGGEAEQSFADVEVMDREEFEYWFKQILAKRDMRLRGLLGSRGSWVLGTNVRTISPLWFSIQQNVGIQLKELGRLFSPQHSGQEYSSEPILILNGGINSCIYKVHNAQRGSHGSFDSRVLPNFAIQLHHTIPKSTRNDTTLASHLGNIDLDLSTSLWPDKWYSLGTGKSVMILDHSRPFYCYLQATMQGKPARESSAIALRVERPVTDKSFLYYQFRSSNFNLISPPLQSCFGSPLFNAQPTADIGYCSANSILDLKDHQGLQMPGDSGMITCLEPSVTHDQSSWQVGCSASTSSAWLYAKYAFNIFGNTATSSPVPDQEAGGIDIEIATYVLENFTSISLIRAMRKFGKTKLGIGMAVDSRSGLLGLGLSFTRWGQDLNLPILIISDDLLNSKWTSVAFGIPLALCALKLWRLWRRRKNNAISKDEKTAPPDPDVEIDNLIKHR